jgi:hypothetical protein
VRRSQWPRGLRRGSAAERIVGSWIRTPPRTWMLSCTVFVLSGRGLCDGPIPRPEESYRLWCVSECDQVQINNLDTYCEWVEEGRTTIGCAQVVNAEFYLEDLKRTFQRIVSTCLATTHHFIHCIQTNTTEFPCLLFLLLSCACLLLSLIVVVFLFDDGRHVLPKYVVRR